MADKKTKKNKEISKNGHHLNASGFTLTKKNGQISNKNNGKTPDIHPTNVEGHYPRFMLSGAVNLLGKDQREMSIILESFLPQLNNIGIKIGDLNNLIREIIVKTEVFRRLKGISQVELLPFAFDQVPWFTRYTHSCLTYVFADYMIEKLNSELKLDSADLEAAKLAFLIHDLGHGPFSHLTERAFRIPKGQKGKTPKEYDHEYWTKILLNELQEQLFDTGPNPYMPKGSPPSREGLKKSNEYNLKIFSKALSYLSKSSNFIVSQLLSSQIDLDRLSNYLGDRLVVSAVLDEEETKENSMVSHLSSYPEVVDNIKRIMNGFVIVDKDLSGNKCDKYLAIHEDALTPVIRFLLDRHIIRYYLLKHHRREAANKILEKILIRAQYLVKEKELDLLGKTDLLIITWLYGNHTEAEFLELDDQLVFNQIRKWAKYCGDPILKDLTQRFMAHHFFKCYSIKKDGKLSKPTEELVNSVRETVENNLDLDFPKELIGEYYFTYDETTSIPYHTDRDEVIIFTNDKKVKKLSEVIKENDNEYGKLLLSTRFERYQFIVPSEINL